VNIILKISKYPKKNEIKTQNPKQSPKKARLILSIKIAASKQLPNLILENSIKCVLL
jgi:hypothetical protein